MADGGQITEQRLQPHNIEAEQALLGALLLNNDIFDRISAILEPHHFYDPVHGRIFSTAAQRIQKNALASPVTLKPFLADDDGLAELGGADYLARLAGAAISIVAAKDYAQMVRDMALRRDLIRIRIVDDAAVSAGHKAPYHVGTHAPETDHAELHCTSSFRDLVWAREIGCTRVRAGRLGTRCPARADFITPALRHRQARLDRAGSGLEHRR